MPERVTREEPLAGMAFLLRSFQLSKMLQVAAAFELAERVAEGPQTVEALARECGANGNMLLRLCRALAAFGIFAVDQNGSVSQTPRSAVLCRAAKPTLHYAARYWTTPGNWAAWHNLEHTVRSGEAAFEATFGLSNFDYLRSHPEEAHLFDSFMQHSPDDRHRAVVEAYDFSDAGLVVDVGGGNGALLAAILSASPNVRGVLYDQEAVVCAAPETLGSSIDRCTIQQGNFFHVIPTGGDTYVLSQILHDWNDERCLEILANCRTAMLRNARLLVIERVLDEMPGRTNPINFLADMQMMVLFPGAKERTPKEFDRLFQQTGFSDGRFIGTSSPFWIIETYPN